MKNTHLLKPDVYLFPLTAEAILMYHALKNSGIMVSGFCDNKAEIHGKTYDSCPVMPLVTGENETVIICGYRQYIHAHLFEASSKIEQFLTEDDVAPALNAIDRVAFGQIAPKQMTKLGRLGQEIRQVIVPVENGFVLNTINIAVTECCNLRCRNCAALMQYYEKPRHVPIETLKTDLDMLMSKTDYVRDIHILGGEPFIYPSLAEYVQHLHKYRNQIGSLYLMTNGTIIPKAEAIEAFREAGVLVRISDYGDISDKKNEVVDILSKNGVVVQITNYPWFWENQLTYGDKTSIQHKFDNCFAKKFNNSICHGKLYFCDFIESAEKLRMIPYSPKNSLVLKDATADDIREYLSAEKAPPGCVLCSGHVHEGEIEAAVQADSILPYKSFAHTYPVE